MENRRGIFPIYRLISWLALIIVLVITGFFYQKQYRTEKAAETIQGNTYQAVFLTNGQVYFGKLREQSKDLYQLDDVYYLQITENLQGTESDENKDAAEGAEEAAPFTLIRLGSELHEPQSNMTINAEHILFWENLKDDSRVVQAIKDFQENN